MAIEVVFNRPKVPMLFIHFFPSWLVHYPFLMITDILYDYFKFKNP